MKYPGEPLLGMNIASATADGGEPGGRATQTAVLIHMNNARSEGATARGSPTTTCPAFRRKR